MTNAASVALDGFLCIGYRKGKIVRTMLVIVHVIQLATL